MPTETEQGVCHPDHIRELSDRLNDNSNELQKVRIALEKLTSAKEALLSAQEAAVELNTHDETIRRMVRDGRLTPANEDRGRGFRLKFTRSEIDRAKGVSR